jgi:hypothetical protein
MTDAEYERKLDELDRLLNDPEVSMEPARIWSLLGELSEREVGVATLPSAGALHARAG